MDWISELHGKTLVVKIGGNALHEAGLTEDFISDVKTLKNAGAKVLLCHGAGPQISAELAKRGIRSEFRGGQRVTSAAAVEVVREVLVEVGATITSELEKAGVRSEAISGDTSGLLEGVKLTLTENGEQIDLGFVGQIDRVNGEVLQQSLASGVTPVVSAIAVERRSSQILNVNADLAAASIAVAVEADLLLLLTNVEGVYSNWPDRSSLVRNANLEELDRLIDSAETGMIPKLSACRIAVTGGVGKAIILDGRTGHPLTAKEFGSSGTTFSVLGAAGRAND